MLNEVEAKGQFRFNLAILIFKQDKKLYFKLKAYITVVYICISVRKSLYVDIKTDYFLHHLSVSSDKIHLPLKSHL